MQPYIVICNVSIIYYIIKLLIYLLTLVTTDIAITLVVSTLAIDL